MAQLDLEALLAGLLHAVNNPLTYIQANVTSVRRDQRELAALVETADRMAARAGPEAATEIAEYRRLRADLGVERPVETLDRLSAETLDGLRHLQRILKAARSVPDAFREGGARDRVEAGRIVQAAALRHGPGVEVSGAPPRTFPGVSHRWSFALDALIRNARESAPGAVAIRVTTDPSRVIVEDSGPGVVAELRERIFHPFFTTRPGGAGLGLTLADWLVAADGGTLTCESTPSVLGGARFTLTLPE